MYLLTSGRGGNTLHSYRPVIRILLWNDHQNCSEAVVSRTHQLEPGTMTSSDVERWISIHIRIPRWPHLRPSPSICHKILVLKILFVKSTATFSLSLSKNIRGWIVSASLYSHTRWSCLCLKAKRRPRSLARAWAKLFFANDDELSVSFMHGFKSCQRGHPTLPDWSVQGQRSVARILWAKGLKHPSITQIMFQVQLKLATGGIRRGPLSVGVLSLHDNARPQTAAATVETIC